MVDIIVLIRSNNRAPVSYIIRYTSMIYQYKRWRMFGQSPSTGAWKCAQKVHFYKPYTSAPGSRHVRLYNVKVIKMSRLAIDRLLILLSFLGSLRCCETDRATNCTTFLSLDTQVIERG